MEISLSRRIFRRATAERYASCLVELRLITIPKTVIDTGKFLRGEIKVRYSFIPGCWRCICEMRKNFVISNEKFTMSRINLAICPCMHTWLRCTYIATDTILICNINLYNGNIVGTNARKCEGATRRANIKRCKSFADSSHNFQRFITPAVMHFNRISHFLHLHCAFISRARFLPTPILSQIIPIRLN